jgi:hypothetical protein
MLENQQPTGHLLFRIAESAVEHLLYHHRQIALEGHCADAIVHPSRQLIFFQNPKATELVSYTAESSGAR